MVQTYFDILNHLGVAQECKIQTDKQTDEEYFRSVEDALH